jgi:zinc transport system substrate-binding protein
VYIFTINLLNGVEEINVECMAEQSVGCLHDYTLTAKDAKLLNDAQVLVINGAGMESFLEDAFESVENLKVIDSSENIGVVCDAEHYHEGEHHHHENSHIWLSLGNAKLQIKNIKNGLVKEFPQYETKIEENYSDYIKRLNALEDERKTVLSLSKELNVISFHGAFEYMAEDLGLNICHTIESDEGHEPSAKELAQLSNRIKKDNIKALFVDPNYNGSAAEILGRETGAEIYVINPVISGEEKLTAYEDIMNENYQMILKAVK